LTGADKNGLRETICLNTAPMFYVSGQTASLKDGIEKAHATIESGQALEKRSDYCLAKQQDQSR
jgi:anthranilate phosphoribosyltransferase